MRLQPHPVCCLPEDSLPPAGEKLAARSQGQKLVMTTGQKGSATFVPAKPFLHCRTAHPSVRIRVAVELLALVGLLRRHRGDYSCSLRNRAMPLGDPPNPPRQARAYKREQIPPKHS